MRHGGIDGKSWLKQGGGGERGRERERERERERATGEAADGSRLDRGVVCVCFAVLGVPLGSVSLTGEMD